MCSDHRTTKRRRRSRKAAGASWRRARPETGFSLIEVMVVVVIIGLLAGAVALKVSGYLETAKTTRAKSDIATIKKAVEMYYLTHHRYPGNDEGLDVLDIENRNDPWGHRYEYNCPGREAPFEVFTLGEDQREGGDGINADIYSSHLEDEGDAGQ